MAKQMISGHTVHDGLVASVVGRLESRPVGEFGWDIWRTIVGLAYLAAAAFNSVYTLPRSEELDVYAEGAWFGFLADFLRDVFMPNHVLFMEAVIVFEVLVGLLVLSRRILVDLGIVASVLWVLAVLPFLAWPYLVTNLVLAVGQAIVMARRYDEAIWHRRSPRRRINAVG